VIRLGVIGHPVGHSLSPIMHGAALAALGRDDVSYEAIDVPPAELARFVRTNVLDGLNVTLPHKQAVIPILAEVDEVARAIGAVNTIVREGERLVGTNTDALGLVRSLEEEGITLRGARCVVLGSGGAARAAVVGLCDAGVASIAVVARRAPAAAVLARELARPGVVLSAHAQDALARAASGVELLIQATSATLGPEAEPFARAIPFEALDRSATVVDLVYRPRVTTVLRRARDHGLRTVDGTGMLVHQGAAALSRWLGVAAPIDVMREAVLGAL
jgi:shikimate dehydrogenase